MLGRTRATARTDAGPRIRAVRVPDSGYVVSLDLDLLARVATEIGPDAEILVEGTLGHYVAFGEVVARVSGVAPDDGSRDDVVRSAFAMDDLPDPRQCSHLRPHFTVRAEYFGLGVRLLEAMGCRST